MKPDEKSAEPTPEPVAAVVGAEAESHADELVAHATRIADSIAADMNHAITMGLATGWDRGLSDADLAVMRPCIAEALRERLVATLLARGLLK